MLAHLVNFAKAAFLMSRTGKILATLADTTVLAELAELSPVVAIDYVADPDKCFGWFGTAWVHFANDCTVECRDANRYGLHTFVRYMTAKWGVHVDYSDEYSWSARFAGYDAWNERHEAEAYAQDMEQMRRIEAITG